MAIEVTRSRVEQFQNLELQVDDVGHGQIVPIAHGETESVPEPSPGADTLGIVPKPQYPNRTRADLIHAVTHMVSGLSADQLQVAVSAVDSLREALGDDVIWNAIEFRHSGLSWLFVNRAPWTRLELIRHAENLRAVQSGENVGSLLNKLRHPERWTEGSS